MFVWCGLARKDLMVLEMNVQKWTTFEYQFNLTSITSLLFMVLSLVLMIPFQFYVIKVKKHFPTLNYTK